MVDFLKNGGLYGVVNNLIAPKTNVGAILVYIAFLALCIVVPYLCGSFNSAIFISRRVFHDDVRKYGSGNAGTTNMLRTFGWKGALPTFFCDILKTAVAILFSWLMLGPMWWVDGGWTFGFSFQEGSYLAMLACVLGHIYPIYYKMKGGKGILCAAVAIGMLCPLALVALIIVFGGTVLFTKYVSLGSIVGAACYPLFLNALWRAFFSIPPTGIMTIVSLLLMALLIYAHRSNIKRLRNHEENKLSLTRRHNREEQPGEHVDSSKEA